MLKSPNPDICPHDNIKPGTCNWHANHISNDLSSNNHPLETNDAGISLFTSALQKRNKRKRNNAYIYIYMNAIYLLCPSCVPEAALYKQQLVCFRRKEPCIHINSTRQTLRIVQNRVKRETNTFCPSK